MTVPFRGSIADGPSEVEQRPLARHLAAFSLNARWAALPLAVQERARLHVLDSLGLALASHAQPFAAPSLAGIVAAGSAGGCSLIGDERRLAARDAALANGLLIHGLDFDDTHLSSIVHPSVASLPSALAVGEHVDAGWEDMLVAYAVGVEAAIRIGAAVKGGFHHVGFHATGIVSHFSSALVAGRLLGLNEAQLCAAQGITASTASGIQVFLEEGAWSKRLHPGWGALAGITAAHLARTGFLAPTRPYEGRFGLFETHLQGTSADPAAITEGLGVHWHLPDTSIKPYPMCHFIHGCADAAIDLHTELSQCRSEIEQVIAWLPQATLPIVAEPAALKQHAKTDYEAKFSAQFVVAKTLLHGRFGLSELSDAAIAEPATQALAARVVCRADPQSSFPTYFSGGVTVVLKDGRTLQRHVAVNKGAGDRALTAEDITAKFLANAALTLGEPGAQRALASVMDRAPRTVRSVMNAMRTPALRATAGSPG
jgi:2-methylcitrate dehydratase PrpD